MPNLELVMYTYMRLKGRAEFNYNNQTYRYRKTITIFDTKVTTLTAFEKATRHRTVMPEEFYIWESKISDSQLHSFL